MGVELEGPNGVVQGNFIGTDATGTVVLPNSGPGMYSVYGNGALIGGTVKGAGNVIAGNGQLGLLLFSSNAVVQGNLIGTNATGKLALPNLGGGISVGGTGDLIGGTAKGAGNIISGNESSGVIGFPAVVQGNFIGTDATGTVALPNMGSRIVLEETGASGRRNDRPRPQRHFRKWGNGRVCRRLKRPSGRKSHRRRRTSAHPLGNASDGVQIYGGLNNTIGGLAVALETSSLTTAAVGSAW